MERSAHRPPRRALIVLGGLAAALATLYLRSTGQPRWPPEPTVPPERPRPALLFGVYAGGHTGEHPRVPPADPNLVLERLIALRGPAPAFNVHLYSAWRDVDETWFWPHYDAEIARYERAGFVVSLTLRYVPPAGHEGDADGFAVWVRGLVARYAARPGVARFIVGNEGNIDTNPAASDGAFRGVQSAIAGGTIAARDAVRQVGSAARVGVNLAVTEPAATERFLRALIAVGGLPFRQAVGVVGLNIYPGTWHRTDADPYEQMRDYIARSRDGLTRAGFGDDVELKILENGYPTPDEAVQAEELARMAQAVIDSHVRYNVAAYAWFALWDADSGSPSPWAHYGLLRDDLSPKPAFGRYRDLIARTAAATPARGVTGGAARP